MEPEGTFTNCMLPPNSRYALCCRYPSSVPTIDSRYSARAASKQRFGLCASCFGQLPCRASRARNAQRQTQKEYSRGPREQAFTKIHRSLGSPGTWHRRVYRRPNIGPYVNIFTSRPVKARIILGEREKHGDLPISVQRTFWSRKVPSVRFGVSRFHFPLHFFSTSNLLRLFFFSCSIFSASVPPRLAMGSDGVMCRRVGVCPSQTVLRIPCFENNGINRTRLSDAP
jgi:hypothetical protein